MEKEKAHDQFKKFLKEGKHRITPERFEVLDYVLEFKGHFGADELFVEMKNNNSNVSRATVYNSLELLAQCDLLSKRNFGENKSYYESAFNRKNHDHLICTDCGSIKEFSTAKITDIVDKICTDLGFESSGYSFNIFGKCSNNTKCSHHKK
ncbi:MAG: transcriptional repressor [Bacteroidetes bacterium]|nr:transcriptional repressor [Bacteroidota bacterium]MBU1678931.1 transcriptional repressor [Bacteroidota bacterium]MBU2506144.1 transcriptional repressor [Bacteroidota bacterium]